MRQIDIMVNARQTEWETSLHAKQVQLDKRNKEVGFMRTQLEDRNYEVCVLQHSTHSTATLCTELQSIIAKITYFGSYRDYQHIFMLYIILM